MDLESSMSAVVNSYEKNSKKSIDGAGKKSHTKQTKSLTAGQEIIELTSDTDEVDGNSPGVPVGDKA